MSANQRSKRTTAAALVGAAALTLTLSGCMGPAATPSGSTAPDDKVKEFTFLTNSENVTIPAVIKSLSTGACSSQNEALPLKIDNIPQTNLDQKLQLLAGQKALPVMYAAGNSPDLTKTLASSGNVLDLEQALTDLGKMDRLEPAAVSTIKSLYDGKLNVLPYQFNVEGFWYNKTLFKKHGIEVPNTWTELVAAADKLNAAGVQPFSASGDQGWPLTRLIGNYIFRSQGPTALKKVADGQAKLTDPEYVKAAQEVANLGSKGYFGQGVGSVDYDGAMNQFMAGKAAMFYMGTWALSNFQDDTTNKVGLENIGFMPFPNVEGGAGNSDQLAANVGLAMTFNRNTYSPKVREWLGCIADNYGSTALKEENSISGFKVSEPVEVDALTKEVQERIGNAKESVLWFEAHFSTKATLTSQQNAAQLVTGKLTAEQFMQKVQADLDRSR